VENKEGFREIFLRGAKEEGVEVFDEGEVKALIPRRCKSDFRAKLVREARRVVYEMFRAMAGFLSQRLAAF